MTFGLDVSVVQCGALNPTFRLSSFSVDPPAFIILNLTTNHVIIRLRLILEACRAPNRKPCLYLNFLEKQN